MVRPANYHVADATPGLPVNWTLHEERPAKKRGFHLTVRRSFISHFRCASAKLISGNGHNPMNVTTVFLFLSGKSFEHFYSSK
jgi:hypothetical protein